MKKLLMLLLVATVNYSLAQEGVFNKTNIYGGKWSSTLFADASVVEGQYKTVYVAGMASEDPDSGKIKYQGDFMGQCKMAYDKIRQILKSQGGDMSNIVRTVAYVTDMRYAKDYVVCQKAALGPSTPLPPHTLLNVNQLAWPGMLVEVEVTAAIPYKKQ